MQYVYNNFLVDWDYMEEVEEKVWYIKNYVINKT